MPRRAGLGSGRVYLRDVGMPQAGEEVGLLAKAADSRWRAEVVSQHLDGHQSCRNVLPPFVDPSHAPLGDEPQDRHAAENATGIEKRGAWRPWAASEAKVFIRAGDSSQIG